MTPQSWTTFKGKEVTLNSIDHQHLGNCYWFSRILYNLDVDNDHIKNLIDTMAERFNGQILPYRPHIDFKEEIEMLERGGYLKKQSNYLGVEDYDIVFKGVKIGEISSPKKLNILYGGVD